MSLVLDVLYRDDELIAMNKPAGMLVHRSWLDKNETVFAMQTLRDQIGQHVFPIHRLDRPTSGVLLFALNSDMARIMSEQFALHQIRKVYLAVVRGYLSGDGRIDYPLKVKLDKIADKFSAPKAAQEAITDYKGVAQVEMPYPAGKFNTARYSLLQLFPQTGRKHQLRRHLKHLHHPIMGDTNYGDLHQNRALSLHTQCDRLFLHAQSLYFTHPKTLQKIEINAPLDQQWQSLFQQFNWYFPHLFEKENIL
ncbi:tRNA pseudouridine synthase C [Nicoletella semolina]|uniref:tRNA pseudouridine synthase C n=1 Tax=Nicoletella semolina TaxID=271160 RepID=A0A4R2N993_9PAST|nr:tRNA pseudouridine(65) synthase TruC [Nicoletella semolina]MDH2925485.1 tRNA pseudouridine(65) synthase TruC [Nicoletella semolina]TCP17559.1 tRNA pseudouridine synthase C [Nicoletella semolina]